MNPKLKSEAQRALANIKSYDLKVFALTVSLGSANLVDIEEEKDKKKKGDLSPDKIDSTSSDLVACMRLINETVPTCSILLVSEIATELLGIVALSIKEELNPLEWALAAAHNVQGTVINQQNEGFVELIIKMNQGASTIKEKENALAASFSYLRSQGLAEEDSDDEGMTYNLDDL